MKPTKAQFMSQYYHQDVGRYRSQYSKAGKDPVYETKVNAAFLVRINQRESWLVLRRLEDITDEEAAEGCGIFDPNDMNGVGVANSRHNFKHSIKHGFYINFTSFSDWARSKRFALPFMGMSVEDQVKEGWVKLID